MLLGKCNIVTNDMFNSKTCIHGLSEQKLMIVRYIKTQILLITATRT